MSARNAARWLPLVAVGALLTAGLAGRLASASSPASQQPIPQTARVKSVYDGDTITLESGDKVRLRWVNTPERKPPEPFADEARAFTERFLRRTEVTLQPSSEGRDGYGRILAGLATPHGDLSLGLLEAGLGHVFIIPPDEVNPAALLAAEAKARAAGRGIWSLEAYEAGLIVTSFHANGHGDDHADPNGEYLRLANVTGAPLDVGGWALRPKSGTRYPLPALTIPAGHTVRVHSGKGPLRDDPSRQLVIHLQQDGPIFDDDFDEVEVLSPDGRVVQRRPSKTRR